MGIRRGSSVTSVHPDVAPQDLDRKARAWHRHRCSTAWRLVPPTSRGVTSERELSPPLYQKRERGAHSCVSLEEFLENNYYDFLLPFI